MNSPTNEELIDHAGFAKWKVTYTLQCSPLNNSGSVKVYVGIPKPKNVLSSSGGFPLFRSTKHMPGSPEWGFIRDLFRG